MSSSLFGPSTTPASYSSQRSPVHTSSHNNSSVVAHTTTAAAAAGVATLGIIATCNYYATIIGYITVLIVGYLIMSWIMSFFGGRSKKKECGGDDDDDDDDERFDDIEDEEPPKRRRKKRD